MPVLHCRKMMSVLVRGQGQGQRFVLTKGAPESVLGRCSHTATNTSPTEGGPGQVVPMTEAIRTTLLDRMAQYGGVGLRSCHVMLDWDVSIVKGSNGSHAQC